MTRDDIVAEAARRLGDASDAFIQDVQLAFNFVLADLAAAECLDLRRSCTDGAWVSGQRDYQTATLAGLTTNYPERVLSLRCWAWGLESLLRGPVSDKEYEEARALNVNGDGEEPTGRPLMWRYYPNGGTIQVFPVPGDEEDGIAIECTYMAPPSSILGSDELTELRPEDVETVVFGLQARMAPMLDETMQDGGTAWQLYIAGRERMYARLHNGRIRDIEPSDV